MVQLLLDAVYRVHEDGTQALRGLTLSVRDGELLVITGPSGSGKTTTLRVVAGLDPVTSGAVIIDGQVVNEMSVQDRDVALVSQDYALYSHLNVHENLRFGLDMRGVPRAEAEQRVAAESRVLRLGRFLLRRPSTLSAGHRQSVALGRATTRKPRVFLLDEPLSALDAGERVRVRTQVRQLLNGLGVTALYVTNDQSEALSIGDRIAVLRDGHLQQVGSPVQLLERPVNRFVAGFLGLPAMHFADATLVVESGRGSYVVEGQRLPIPAGVPGPLRALAGRSIVLGIRPHQLRDVSEPVRFPGAARLEAQVERVEKLGHMDLVLLRVGDQVLGAAYPAFRGPPLGTVVEVAVDTAQLHIYDPASEAALWHGRDAAT